MLAINNKNNRHTTPPQTNIAFIMPRPKSIGSHHKSGTRNNQGRQKMSPFDNRCFKSKESHRNSNKLSSPVIPVPPPLNYSIINPPKLSFVCRQSSRYSQNKTPELQDYSITGRTSPHPSNTMPPQSTNNGSRNIYEFMVDVSKLTPAQRQQHVRMLLQKYHKLCNKNDPSSMSVSPPPITNIESYS